MTQLVPEPTASTAKVELYPHAPTTLLPLLRTQLPHTIVLIGTILANRHSDADPAPITAPDVRVPPPLPPLYATFPAPSDGSDITSEYLAQIGVGEFDWLVVVALPVPSEQIRFYHSLVASPPLPDDKKVEAKEEAERTIEAALRFMNTLYPDQLVAGCTHEMWEGVTRRVLGGKRQDPTLIYVAPGGGFGHTEIEVVRGWEDELVLDHGREGDKALIFKHNHYRVEDYYGARAAHLTVLRRRVADGTTPPPEVFVQCHGDGSLGALHTQEGFRRRGLAKVVLKAHLDKYEALAVPGFCYIEEYNRASIALFEGLGWRRLPWAVYWVFERSVQAGA